MDILCCFFSDFIFFDLGVSAHLRAAHFRVIFLRTFIRLGQLFLMAVFFCRALAVGLSAQISRLFLSLQTPSTIQISRFHNPIQTLKSALITASIPYARRVLFIVKAAAAHFIFRFSFPSRRPITILC